MGDRRRSTLGRAVVAVLAASLVFYADIWLSKEIPALYAHTAWRDDPYDALVSFMFVAVPLLLCLSAVRLRLCRRFEPLPVRRALDLLQICRLLCLAMAVTLAGEWVSVAVAGPRAGAGPVSAGLIAILGLMSATVLGVMVYLRKARHTTWARGQAPPDPDWLADAVTLLERESSSLGGRGARLGRAVRCELAAQVLNRLRRNGQICGLWFCRRRPQIGIPHRRGCRKHFAELFFNHAIQTRRARDVDFRQTGQFFRHGLG